MGSTRAVGAQCWNGVLGDVCGTNWEGVGMWSEEGRLAVVISITGCAVGLGFGALSVGRVR